MQGQGSEEFDRNTKGETPHSVCSEQEGGTEDDEYHSAPERGEADAEMDGWVQMHVQKELIIALDVGQTRVKKRVLKHETPALSSKGARTMDRMKTAVKHQVG